MKKEEICESQKFYRDLQKGFDNYYKDLNEFLKNEITKS